MDTLRATYPFGLASTRRPPSASRQRPLFVLGAYPSAFHVGWEPPAPYKSIRAIAVDDEPTPFWDGRDEDGRLRAWKAAVRWDDARHGTVSTVGKLNGSSGVWVDDNVLRPLGFGREQAWITDCLDTYFCSIGASKRIADTYAPFAQERGLAAAVLPRHPSEDQIVERARAEEHRTRLGRELAACNAEVIVTLGNAALRVFREVAGITNQTAPSKLDPNPTSYGRPVPVRVGGRVVRWFPLAHPASPTAYQGVHRSWSRARERG